MEKFVVELCEILEVPSLDVNVSFAAMPEWDSLNALSVIALLDSCGILLSAEKLEKFETIKSFLEYVSENRKN